MRNEPSGDPKAPRAAPPRKAFRTVRQVPPLLSFLLFFLILLTTPARAADHEVSCPAAAAAVAASSAYVVPAQALLRDPSGLLSVDEVAAPARAADFVPIPGQLSAGYTRDALWLRLCLPPADAGARSRWLRIAPPMLDKLALYLPQGDGYAEHRAGDHLPFSEREWNYRLFAIPVPPGTDTARPAYLRIETTSALNMRIDLWSEAEFQRLVALESMFYGVLVGTVVLLVAFSLVSWRWLGETLYLFYAANVLAGGFFLLMNAGFGSQFLYPESGAMNDRFIAWFTGPILAVHVLFFTYLFAVRRHLPRMYPMMLALAAVYALLAPASFLTDWRNIGVLLQLLAFPVTLLWMLLVVYLGWKDRERRIYIFAFLPWLLGLFGNAMLRLGNITESFLIYYSGEITALIHLIILPVLIIHRTRQAELEKDRALARELVEAHRVERELEARVRSRTQELRQEIATRGRLQEQLKNALETERATLANQRQFVAMLSHEFRTPLAIIDTAAQRLDMRLEKTQPELMPRVGKIRRAVQRLLNLLENCLASERLNGPGLELRLEDLDLRAYLANDYVERALTGTQRIRLELPEDAVRVRCDRHLFDVALSNLVDNALKYSPEDRPVHVRLLPEASAGVPSGMVAIEVRDEGAGIRPEDRERVFERFFRSEGQPRISGAGLGLHLAQVLARRHGGDLALSPAVPGAGATFVLTLPTAGARVPAEELQPA